MAVDDPENWNTEKIDEAVLALLYLTSFQGKKWEPTCTWKGYDWDALNRLHEAGLIGNPKSKAKSVAFTEEGWGKCQEAFEKLFTDEREDGAD